MSRPQETLPPLSRDYYGVKCGRNYDEPFRIWWEVRRCLTPGKPEVRGEGPTLKEARLDARRRLAQDITGT